MIGARREPMTALATIFACQTIVSKIVGYCTQHRYRGTVSVTTSGAERIICGVNEHGHYVTERLAAGGKLTIQMAA